MNIIMKDNVVVVAGETGSGKSTQIPQFILEVNLTLLHMYAQCCYSCTMYCAF